MRVDGPVRDSSATVLESYPSTARRPLLCPAFQPLHPYACSTYRQIFARFDPHLGHARLLAPPKAYRCGSTINRIRRPLALPMRIFGIRQHTSNSSLDRSTFTAV